MTPKLLFAGIATLPVQLQLLVPIVIVQVAVVGENVVEPKVLDTNVNTLSLAALVFARTVNEVAVQPEPVYASCEPANQVGGVVTLCPRV